MTTKMKNIKISETHHNVLKNYCDNRGLKIHRILEKWIEENCKMKTTNNSEKKKDLYDE